MTARQVAMLLTLAAAWGASFLFIRVSVEALGPVALSEARTVLAGASLMVWAAAIGTVPRLRARWRGWLVLGAVNSAAPFTLINLAELELTASLAAVLNASTPLFAALVAAVWLGERIGALRAVGLAGGIGGVAVVVGLSPVSLDVAFLAAVGASLLAALAYGFGGHLVRQRWSDEAPLSLAIGQQLGAAVTLAPFLVVAPPRTVPSAGVTLAVLALALLCTAFAYLLYFRLITELGATSALTVTFLVPVFGVTWAALFLGEAIEPATVLGGLIVLVSVGAVTVGGRRVAQAA